MGDLNIEDSIIGSMKDNVVSGKINIKNSVILDQPSRELDALIAEKVMRLGPATHVSEWLSDIHPDDVDYSTGGGLISYWCRGCHGDEMPPLVRITQPKKDEIHHNYKLLHYSTDIAAAWEIVERGFLWPGHVGKPMLHVLRECANGQWECQWCSDFGYSEIAYANTAPLAICQAALKAVGND